MASALRPTTFAPVLPPRTDPSGRAFEVIPSGTRVLVVTDPALVYAILREAFAQDPAGLEHLEAELVGLLDAVQANVFRGVYPGIVSNSLFECRGNGLWPIVALVSLDAVPVIDTAPAIRAALGRSGLSAFPSRHVPGDGALALTVAGRGYPRERFIEEHPWFEYAGLDLDARNRLLLALGDDAVDRAALALENRAMLEEVVNLIPGADEALTRAVERAKAAGADGLEHEVEVRALMIAIARAALTRRPAETFQLVLRDDASTRCLLALAHRGIVERIKVEVCANAEDAPF